MGGRGILDSGSRLLNSRDVVRVVFLGPPGAGKGTQAKFLEGRFGACLVSTGEILRKAVREETPLGKRAAGYVRKGELVPDDLMVELMAERLRQKDCQKGFILDGFPRTIAQADGLDTVLRDAGWALDGVLSLQVPCALSIQRLAERRTCRNCGSLFHLAFNPPKQGGVCDRCGGELYQREDDREDTIAARIQVHEVQTAPLLDYYREKGLLIEIDGVGRLEEVRARVLQALEGPGV